MSATEAELRAAVEAVRDPELPVLTLADLGVLRDVRLKGDRARVEITPTYVACPAMGAIKDDVRRAVTDLGLEPEVEVVLSPPWHPGLITERGRQRLAAAGIAPPRSGASGPTDLGMPETPVTCPRCGSRETRVLAERGPTPCTAIRVCQVCREPFEQVREQ